MEKGKLVRLRGLQALVKTNDTSLARGWKVIDFPLPGLPLKARAARSGDYSNLLVNRGLYLRRAFRTVVYLDWPLVSSERQKHRPNRIDDASGYEPVYNR